MDKTLRFHPFPPWASASSVPLLPSSLMQTSILCIPSTRNMWPLTVLRSMLRTAAQERFWCDALWVTTPHSGGRDWWSSLGQVSTSGPNICGEWPWSCCTNTAIRDHHCSYRNREEGVISRKSVWAWRGGGGSGIWKEKSIYARQSRYYYSSFYRWGHRGSERLVYRLNIICRAWKQQSWNPNPGLPLSEVHFITPLHVFTDESK